MWVHWIFICPCSVKYSEILIFSFSVSNYSELSYLFVDSRYWWMWCNSLSNGKIFPNWTIYLVKVANTVSKWTSIINFLFLSICPHDSLNHFIRLGNKKFACHSPTITRWWWWWRSLVKCVFHCVDNYNYSPNDIVVRLLPLTCTTDWEIEMRKNWWTIK